MDLLGRKTKQLLSKVIVRAEQLEAERNELMRLANIAHEQCYTLTGYIRQLEEEVAKQQTEVQINRQVISNLHEAIQAVKRPPPKKEPMRSLHIPEEEAELKWQLDNGYIDTTEYESLLKELDFQNATITMDPDYRPRPDLTY